MNTHTDITEISLTAIDGDPRARDIDLAEKLGFSRQRDIRKLIERHKPEIEKFGTCATVARVIKGNPVTEYWLNEEQAILVSVLSEAPRAAEVRNMLIKVFVAWRRGHLASLDADRHFGISKMTIHKVTNMEKTIDALVSRVNELMLATDARVAALEYISVRGLLEEAKAIQKGRRRLNRKIGWELRERALLSGLSSPCRKCPHSGVWLYQRDFASAYMIERGNSLVASHNAAVSGQGVLKLIRS